MLPADHLRRMKRIWAEHVQDAIAANNLSDSFHFLKSPAADLINDEPSNNIHYI